MPELPRKIRTVLDLLVTELELTVAVALAYVGAMVIVAYGVKLVQDSLYDHPLLVPSLVFLPPWCSDSCGLFSWGTIYNSFSGGHLDRY